MIAGFRCQDGIVVCADTQETLDSAKRNVPKLEFTKGPTWSAEKSEMINHDLALALCGAGHGPFVDKIASRAWDALRGIADIDEASDAVESMIKKTYQEFGQIYQPGSFPEAELIYGITIGGQSRLFQACGPLVLEKSYASSGIGHYLADFLAERMGANGEHGWLTTRQCVAVASYILFQAKEHVEGCGGNSHIAVLREAESSGMVDFQLVEHLTEYLKLADRFTGELLLDTADFSMSDSALAEKFESSIGVMKHIRAKEMEKLKEDREFSRSLFCGMLGSTLSEPEDDLGLPKRAAKPESAHPND
jgi:20S proteasome alpha/beta subunit